MADPTYAIFVRVPVPRGSFVDPPAVNWDSAKDEALWKILSGATQNEIDWNLVADRFQVQVDFLVQQVAYLTERHASQVRAQVRKATAAAKGSATPSPIPGSESTGAPNLRTASALSVRRESPMPRGEGTGAAVGICSTLNTSSRPPISRNASANTAVPRDAGTSSPKMGNRPSARTADSSRRRRLSSLPIPSPSPRSPVDLADAEADGKASSDPASSSTSSDEESSPAQSRIIRRPPRYQQPETFPGYRDDDEEESEPAFQVYKPAPAQSSGTSSHDLTSTLRGNTPNGKRRSARNVARDQTRSSQTSDSSTSSHALLSRPGKQRDQRGTVPSPRRATELAAGRSARDTGSDGTPSMGSSFSDLDDTSVTQSALEEALASQLNRGTASRFSISHAFRSRYTSSSN